MKKIIIAIVVVIVGVIAYFAFVQNPVDPSIPNPTSEEDGSEDDTSTVEEGADNDSSNGADVIEETTDDNSENDATTDERIDAEHRVVFNGSAYVPNLLNIKKGDSVTWVNESMDKKTWPASAVHPTHTVYPTTGGCLGSTLDACKVLDTGETFSFVFEEIGTWKMHDHVAPSITMTVVVTE